MPKRNITKRIDSKEVQGEGSYVILKRLTIGYVKEMRDNAGEKTNLVLNAEAIRDHVIEWNWVDSDDDPWPLPSKDLAVLDAMTFEETDFLIGALFGSGEARKN